MLAAMITLQQVSRVTDQSRFMGHESACQDIDGRREARLDGLEGVWWLVGWEPGRRKQRVWTTLFRSQRRHRRTSLREIKTIKVRGRISQLNRMLTVMGSQEVTVLCYSTGIHGSRGPRVPFFPFLSSTCLPTS